jgi:hypothetical protein
MRPFPLRPRFRKRPKSGPIAILGLGRVVGIRLPSRMPFTLPMRPSGCQSDCQGNCQESTHAHWTICYARCYAPGRFASTTQISGIRHSRLFANHLRQLAHIRICYAHLFGMRLRRAHNKSACWESTQQHCKRCRSAIRNRLPFYRWPTRPGLWAWFNPGPLVAPALFLKGTLKIANIANFATWRSD